ncbi:MAG TPA: glutamate-5-semialdehyde dehydrogenase [Chthoniobacterales bacterium]
MMTFLQGDVERLGQRAREAGRVWAQASTQQKNAALLAMAGAIEERAEEILAANRADVEAARLAGAAVAVIDRLRVDDRRLQAMADGIRNVALLHDPVGEIIKEWTRPNGLRISKVRVPIGVIGFIYESRPNVTSDAAALCLKTGNAIILRGGSEAFHSNMAIAQALRRGCESADLPVDGVQLVPTTDRAAVQALAELDRYVDLLIPRGGRSLIERVTALARMPVIKHFDGICHVYVDRDADPQMAQEIVLNAKVQRPGVCNAVETLLVHEAVAPTFLPRCAQALAERHVELRGDPATCRILGALARPAHEEDWRIEYLDLILSIRVVSDLEAAIRHIEEYGSHHTDTVVTDNEQTADRFLRAVDSAVVLWNASTRFNDGGEFGFGAEVGISTDRLHARGPMGLEELTTYKYLVRGSGQVRE